MAPTPIYTAILLVRKAVRDALVPLMQAATPPTGLSYTDTAGRVKCYWHKADQEDANHAAIVLPYTIFQSQDGGGKAIKHLNGLGWEGLITVKALASKQSIAEALIDVVAPGMENLSVVGYSISAEYEGPLDLPVMESTWQAAQRWRVFLEPA